MSNPAEDIHTRIENTLQILESEVQRVAEPARHDLILAMETLRASADAIRHLEGELDLVTAPDLDAAEEAQKLREHLDAAQLRIAGLEQQVVELRENSALEDQIHAEEHERLRELEKQAKEMEGILGSDEAAFGRFMEQALDKDEQAGRIKKREP